MVQLTIKLLGHMLAGGGQSSAAADLATVRRSEGGREVPYIPATAIRGAIRIQLEALLRGSHGSAIGPYPLEDLAEDSPRPPEDAASRLFGYSGRAGERANSKHGQLRFSDALPIDPDSASGSLSVRAGVEIDDYSGVAEDKKLFFREVVEVAEQPHRFQCWLDTGDACEKDLGLLRLAVETTSSVGAGRSSGGGEIEIEWKEAEPPKLTQVIGGKVQASRARLTLELVEPAHFGDGGPFGNHHATKNYIPGSTLRGAVAWALLRNGCCQADDYGFQAMFIEEPAVSFGDALPVDDAASDPALNPITLRKPRRGVGSSVDLLRRELTREQLNAELSVKGLYLRPNWKDLRPEPEPARRSEKVVRRTRTRVSLDRYAGSAAEGKLFSIEQIEPKQATDPTTGAAPPTIFVSWIEGLTPQTAELLSKLEGKPLLVGAGRNHGMGLANTTIQLLPESTAVKAEETVHQLRDALNQELETLAIQLELDISGLLWKATFPLVLMAVSDFIPVGGVEHPLAEFEAASGKPFRKLLRGGAVGGYDQLKESNGAQSPLKDLAPSVAAGSLFVYRVAAESLHDILLRALRKLRRGVGAGVRNGCGRFVLYEEPQK